MSKSAINALFAIAALVVPACAIFEPRWEAVAPPMEPVWVHVSAEQVRSICPHQFACVRRRLETLTCLIFAPVAREDAPQFLIDHEEVDHCKKGKNHD